MTLLRRRGATLRARVTLLSVALVTLVLGVSGIALVVVQHHVLLSGIDEALIQRADNVRWTASAALVGRTTPPALTGEGDSEDSFLQVLDHDGRVLASTANVAGLPAVTAPVSTGQALRTVRVATLSGHRYRVLARALPASTGAEVLVAGKNTDDVQESVSTLRTSLAIALPSVVALLAALIWWLTGRLLRPVEAIRSEVAQISASELERRVPIPRGNDEITRLARTMNAMLARVHDAIERQQAFVADASHELRSPLARIRSTLEIGARPGGLEVPPAQTFTDALGDVAAMQRLLDDLLFLARADAGQQSRAAHIVDLDDVVLAEAARLRARAAVSVDTRGVQAARTSGDPRQIARAVTNLAENAERHAASTVTFTVTEVDGRSTVTVSDDGPGIAPEDRERIFTRFTRLDTARSRDDGGVGLGLAIVTDIAARHGGTIEVRNAEPSGARFVLSFPRVD